MRHVMGILIAAACAGLLTAPAWGQPQAGRIVPGSRAHQLLLRAAIEKELDGTLVAELNQNKKVWGSLSPEELRELRERAYAFLKKDPDQQADLIESANDFHRLTDEQQQAFRERAAWLEKVVSSLTPQEREELLKMTPAERAKRLLELKAGLADSQPASAPTSPAPATRPGH